MDILGNRGGSMPKVRCGCHNGKCKPCGGTGLQAFSKINEGIFGVPLLCIHCHGTKQCQDCGGTGKVWEDPPPGEPKKPKHKKTRTTSGGGGEGGGGYVEPGAFPKAFGLLFAGGIVVLLVF